MNETTIAQRIATMNDEEIAAYNKELNKKLLKKVGASLAVSIVGLVAVEYITRNIDKNDEEN